MRKGSKASPETRARMSEAMRRRYAEGRGPVLSATARRKQARSLKRTHAERKANGGWRITAMNAAEPVSLPN